MRIKTSIGLFMFLLIGIVSCKTQKGKFQFVSPSVGERIVLGGQVKLTLNFPIATIDSVVYSVDGVAVETKMDTSSVILDSEKYGLGDKSLSAKLYFEGKEDVAYRSLMVLPPAAKQYAFEVVNVFPHDTKAFTQGLQFVDGFLFESTGGPNIPDIKTSLRKVELNTGKVLQILEPEEDFFGEGITVLGNKIVFLSWEKGEGYFYDKNTFKRVGSFKYGNSKEGWGITFDGEKLIKSDGSSLLYFLDPDTGKELQSIQVYDENGAVDSLNELEYIDGKVYANIYQKEIIVIINPKTGAVEGRINLVGMNTEDRMQYDNELNGIAYDSRANRLFVTGKLWPRLYEIKLVER